MICGRAIHRAKFGEVQLGHLDNLSRWVAWLIISMTALTERGYRTPGAVKEQVVRLDNWCGRGQQLHYRVKKVGYLDVEYEAASMMPLSRTCCLRGSTGREGGSRKEEAFAKLWS